MSSHEFAEWMAYEQVAGPLGAERGDLHFAVLETLVHNLWAKDRKKLADFLPVWGRRRQTPEEMQAVARMLNAMAGGKEE